MDFNNLFDFVIRNGIATEEECRLVCYINGTSVCTLNDIIEVRTGYHDAEQLHDCEPENYDFSMLALDDDEEEEYLK
jgi:hypothetical protein